MCACAARGCNYHHGTVQYIHIVVIRNTHERVLDGIYWILIPIMVLHIHIVVICNTHEQVIPIMVFHIHIVVIHNTHEWVLGYYYNGNANPIMFLKNRMGYA